MAVQTYPYLIFTDGTTTVTAQDGAGGVPFWPLKPNGWLPTIPAYNPSALAGRGQYAEVVQEFNLTVRGASAADAYANLETLYGLIDQADRWALDEAVSAVLVKCAPQGSTLSSSSFPLQAAIMGRAEGGDDSGVSLTEG